MTHSYKERFHVLGAGLCPLFSEGSSEFSRKYVLYWQVMELTHACTRVFGRFGNWESLISWLQAADRNHLPVLCHSAYILIYLCVALYYKQWWTFTSSGRPATQVSTYGTAVAGIAVDGVYSGGMQHTDSYQYPWLCVDLQSLRYVCGVKIWNRAVSGSDG